MHQWMTDSGLTPHLIVDVAHEGVEVPREHIREGRIVLNVSYDATRHLDLGNDWIIFEARFGGVPRQLRFPNAAVLSIYARETGEGLMFPAEEDAPPPPSPIDPAPGPLVPDRGLPSGGAGSAPAASARPKRPSLKVVK
jgi:stringent starvation protein B